MLFCIMIASFMQVLDQTIANVALPHMQGSLQANRDEITWVLTSYVLAAAVMTPPVGWLASRFGRKNILIVSLIGFTTTSALCGAAQSLDEMVLFRLLQGAFGAAISPVTQSIIFDRFPLEQRAKVMSLWAMVVLLGPVIGPTLGGWLTESMSWRWVFFINVPFGLLSTLGIAFFLTRSRRPHVQRFDSFGFAVICIALCSLQLALDRGTTKGWLESPEIVIEFAIAALASYLFAVHFFTSSDSIFPRQMFFDRNFVSASVLTFTLAGLLLASSALLPPFLQTGAGYSVLDAGWMMAPRGFGGVLAMVFVGRVTAKTDLRYLVVGGSVVLIATFYEMSRWTPDINPIVIGMTTAVQGFAISFVFIPANLLAFATLPAPLRTDGAAFMNLNRQMGSAVGVSLTTTVISTMTQVAHANLSWDVTPFNRALSFGAGGMYWNLKIPMGVEGIAGVVDRNATTIAYSDTFLLMFFMSWIVPIMAFMLRPSSPAAPPGPTEIME